MNGTLDVALTALVVGAAACFLVWKLVVAPAVRARRPDVPLSRLVRKSPPPRKPAGGCHDH